MPRPFKLLLTPRSTLPPSLPSPLRIPPAHYTAHLHPHSAIEPRATKARLNLPPHLPLSKREKSIIGTPLTLLPRTPTRHSTYTPTTPHFEDALRSPTTPKRDVTRRLVRKKGSRSLILSSLNSPEFDRTKMKRGVLSVELPRTPITPDMVEKVRIAELERLTREVWTLEKAKVVRMDRPIGGVRVVEVRRKVVGLGIVGVGAGVRV